MCMREPGRDVTLSEAKGTMAADAPLAALGVTTGAETPVSRTD